MVEKFGQSDHRDALEVWSEEATILHQRITNLKRLLAEAERENRKLRSQLEAKDTVPEELSGETDIPPESQRQEGDRAEIETSENDDSESPVIEENEENSTLDNWDSEGDRADIETSDRDDSDVIEGNEDNSALEIRTQGGDRADIETSENDDFESPVIEENEDNSALEIRTQEGETPEVESSDTHDSESSSADEDSSGAIANAKNGKRDFTTNGSAKGKDIDPNAIVPVNQNTSTATATAIAPPKPEVSPSEEDYLDEIPDEAEMSLFDHLEELRQRIFYSLIAVVIAIVLCFIAVKPIVQILQIPAQGVKMLQLAPGEYFFVSLKVAGYSGLILSSPFIIYQIVQFVLPGLTRRERRILGPIFLGSTFLFLIGLIFAYSAIVPAALKFFIGYGAEVVEQLWSIAEYFEFVLKLLFVTALAFQVPIILILLGILGIVSSKQMFSGWRYVVLAAAVLGAILTPSTDPLTQSLLGGAVVVLYFGGVGVVRLMGK